MVRFWDWESNGISARYRGIFSCHKNPTELCPRSIAGDTPFDRDAIAEEYKRATAGWTLPGSKHDCARAILGERAYPTFIGEDDRCGGGGAADAQQCDDLQNLMECGSFVDDPNEYLQGKGQPKQVPI